MKALTTAAVVLAIGITLAICWHWDIGVLGGKYGIHGGWGFEIFVVVFAILYIPIWLIGRRRKVNGGGSGGDESKS